MNIFQKYFFFTFFIFSLTSIEGTEPSHDGDVVFIGDSITEWFDPEIWDDYYAPLQAVNVGKAGDTTQNLIDRIENGLIRDLDSRIAILQIGTNDLSKGRSVDYVARQIGKILKLIKENDSNVRIILIGILPRLGKTLHGKVRSVNKLIGKYADGDGVTFLDMEPQFSVGLGQIIPQLYTDGLHLSQEGYRVWADSMAKTFNTIYYGNFLTIL